MQRRRTVTVTVTALAAVALVAFVLVQIVSVPRAMNGRGSAACVDPVVTGPQRQRWTCTFDEEFTGSRLDPSRWQVTTTSQYGFHSGTECYVDDGQHVRVTGGHLVLTVTRKPRPQTCTGYETPYQSGMITSSERFAQTYGRFEIRARLPAVPGVQPALWLFPQQPAYGPWPGSGEIDIAEVFGERSGRTWPHLHYLGANGLGASVGQGCSVSRQGRGFHTYAVDWSPSGFRFDYDGRACLQASTLVPIGALPQPAPFNQPFYLLLELALGVGANAPTPTTPLPARMEVDYVRVWGA